MKELLEKFLGAFSEGVKKLSEGNEAEAIKKFTEASEMTESLNKKAEENKEVDIAKVLESEKGQEALKKYVDIYLSSDSISGLADKLRDQLNDLEELSKKVETLEKEKKEDDEIITKAFDEQGDEIESIKKTLETRVSKID